MFDYFLGLALKGLRVLYIEIYKTNSLNPSFMNDAFKVKTFQRLPRDKYKLNLDISKWNQLFISKRNLWPKNLEFQVMSLAKLGII